MSFGFSVGDFIAVGKIIVDLVETLRGSQAEYQELIRELENLEKALHQVDKLKSRGSNALAVDQIKYAALSCRYPLEDFLSKIKKYEKSLGLGESAGKVRDAGRKVQWAFGKKTEVYKLRDYLNVHIGTINMLLVMQGLDMLDVAAGQSDQQQQALKTSVERSLQELQDVRGDVRAQALTMRDNSSLVQKLSWMIGSDVVAPMRVLIHTVGKLCVSAQQIYTIVLETHARVARLDTGFTFLQAPVRVEDALGRVFPFPSECSFQALNAEIKHRFNHGPGRGMVEAGQYEILNARNEKQVLTASQECLLLPGMSVSMAMTLQTPLGVEARCVFQH